MSTIFDAELEGTPGSGFAVAVQGDVVLFQLVLDNQGATACIPVRDALRLAEALRAALEADAVKALPIDAPTVARETPE